MKLSSNPVEILTLAVLAILVLPALVQHSPTAGPSQFMASYNPAPANNFKAPLSSPGLVGLASATPDISSAAAQISASNRASSISTIQQNSVRFIIDNSYFPQSETTIAVDPNNPDRVVGGFNDGKWFFCPLLPQDCTNPAPASISGFTTSTDGGRTVAKSSDLPDLNQSGTFLVSWGDPSIAPSVDGNFFYASLAINPRGPVFGDGVMIAKSNSNLFDPSVSCVTPASNPLTNSCWNTVFIEGITRPPNFSFEDKDRIAVDQNTSSPYYGYIYIGWDHFTQFGTSSSYLARCTPDLSSCIMLSPGLGGIVSGNDPFVAWTTPIVDKAGNVHVAWCNFGTASTFGPVNCRIRSSPPGGRSFGTINNILGYMGTGTTLPTDTVVIGWATEQFRTGAGLISIAADESSKTNNLYFTTPVCVSGHYYAFSPFVAPVAFDNPGDCGASATLFSRSTDGGTTWSSPTTLSKPAVNDQAYVTVDSQMGTVTVVYYTTQYDIHDHLIDVVASISNNAGQTFHQQRITSVSDEPNSDPNLYNYTVPNGTGGSFVVPQYGDYFEATQRAGTLYVLFTGNYAVEQGTFQADPFLAVVNQN